MADIQLKVSPQELKSKSGEIEKQIAYVEPNLNSINDVIKSTKSYWEGEAGDQYRKFLKDNDSEIQKILKRMKEHPTDLQKMAGVYDEAERKARQLAEGLSDQIIV